MSVRRETNVQLLLEELRGPLCQCGDQKKPGQSFCRRCFFRLTAPLRDAMYRRIGDGYEAAYQRAIDFLKQDLAIKAGEKRRRR